MNQTKKTSGITPSSSASPDYQESLDNDDAGMIYQENGLDTTQEHLRTEELKTNNKHATNSLVARMLWGHEEKSSLNMRVSEDGTLDLNDDVR